MEVLHIRMVPVRERCTEVYYSTFWYTEDAAAGFDVLNSPTYQCNHADGEHKRHAGGKLADGRWTSEDFTAFPSELNAFIAFLHLP